MSAKKRIIKRKLPAQPPQPEQPRKPSSRGHYRSLSTPQRCYKCVVDPQTDMVRVGGVVIGRRVVRDGKVGLLIHDKDRRRVARRGHPVITLEDLIEALIEVKKAEQGDEIA